MSLMKKFAAAAALVLPIALAGCGEPATPLCPDEGPGIGKTSYSEVFNGAASLHKVCAVNGYELQMDGRYEFENGLLIIRGDVPQSADINVDNGKIFIDGNVQEKAKVDARVPEETSTYTTTSMVYNGKMMIPITHVHSRFEGFTYAYDDDPAVTIAGTVEKDVRITSNHGIHISEGFSTKADLRSTRDTAYDKVTNGRIAGQYIAPVVKALTH